MCEGGANSHEKYVLFDGGSGSPQIAAVKMKTEEKSNTKRAYSHDEKANQQN